MGQEVCAPCKQFSTEEKSNEITKNKNIIFSNDIKEINDNITEINKDNNGTNRNKLKSSNSNELDQKEFLERWEKQLPLLGTKIQNFNDFIPENLNNFIITNPYQNTSDNTSRNENINKKNYPAPAIQFKSNNNIYDGSWNENLRLDGYGKMYMKNADVLAEGIWENGVYKNGRVFLPNGDRYEGEIYNSNFNGKGKLIMTDGSEYNGDFFDGKKNGKGIMIFPDKSIYKGEFKNNFLNGKGELIWNNGIKYEGEFLNSKISGEGKIVNENGNSYYVGEFLDNKFHGKGKYVFNNGDVYEGEYKFGKKNGMGKYYNNNFCYNGNWSEGKPHGIGEFNIQNKNIQCSWRNGEVVEIPHDLNNYYNNLENEKDLLNFEPQNEDINCDNLGYLIYDKKNLYSFKPETYLSDSTI